MMAVIGEEVINKAKAAENLEDFMAVLEENGLGFPRDKAQALYEELKSEDELPDNELDAVSGGSGSFAEIFAEWKREIAKRVCPKCGDKVLPLIRGVFTDFTCRSCGEHWHEQNPWV